MIVSHRHSPMRHRTAWVFDGYVVECLFGQGVRERVQQRHRSVEHGRYCRAARGRKFYSTEPLWWGVITMVLHVHVVSHGRGGERKY